ncbi:MAG: helix-turn-helix domain-containing protein [Candidatus Kerfeldbacteria bacterium]
MNLPDQLTQLGLNAKQSKIYLSALELGQASVLEISRKARIKRSTTYVVLDELQERSLVRQIKKGATTLYESADPSVLGQQLEQQLDSFRSMKPLLDDLYMKEGTKPNVRFYSGSDEFVQLYETIFRDYSTIDFFGTDAAKFEKIIPQSRMDAWLGKMTSGEVVAREILTLDQYNLAWAKKNVSRFHKVRLIDDRYPFFGDNALYGNTLLVASLEEPFAVTIESKDVVRTFRSLFDLAWNQAKPPRDIPKKGRTDK